MASAGRGRVVDAGPMGYWRASVWTYCSGVLGLDHGECAVSTSRCTNRPAAASSVSAVMAQPGSRDQRQLLRPRVAHPASIRRRVPASGVIAPAVHTALEEGEE